MNMGHIPFNESGELNGNSKLNSEDKTTNNYSYQLVDSLTFWSCLISLLHFLQLNNEPPPPHTHKHAYRTL